MKLKFALIIFLDIFLYVTAQNLLLNGDFEDNDGDVVEGWTFECRFSLGLSFVAKPA